MIYERNISWKVKFYIINHFTELKQLDDKTRKLLIELYIISDQFLKLHHMEYFLKRAGKTLKVRKWVKSGYVIFLFKFDLKTLVDSNLESNNEIKGKFQCGRRDLNPGNGLGRLNLKKTKKN